MQNLRRTVTLLLSAAILLTTTGLAPIAAADPTAAVPVIRLDGRGHGHGVGMSQWGAYTMASKGASAADIIGAFYPGTQLGSLGGEVVVVVDARDHVRLAFPGGGEVRSARSGGQHPGFPVRVERGGTVDIVRTPEGYRVTGGSVAALESSGAVRYSTAGSAQDCVLVVCSPDDEEGGGDDEQPPTTSPPAPPTTEPQPAPEPEPEPAPQPQPEPSPQGSQAPVSPTPVWAVPDGGSLVRSIDRGRSYRGLFEVTGPPGGVRVRNHLDIEDYLKGMAEVPSTWPAAAVQAQAIAARTYALRAMAASGELCDSESCQVYVGTAHEAPGQVAAVDATRGTVVMHGGALASTFYSASGGGHSANVAEGFGSGYDVPYLQARPYETVHPDIWSIDIAVTDVARRLGYPGALQSVTVDATGPSGRPLQMTLHGDAGPVGVDPQDFRRRLGLRSTLFTVRTAETEVAPPPPPEAADPGVVGDVVGDDDAAVTSRRSIDALSTDRQVALTPPDASAARPWTLAVLAAVLAVLVCLAATRQLPALAPAGSRWRPRLPTPPALARLRPALPRWRPRPPDRLRRLATATMSRWRRNHDR